MRSTNDLYDSYLYLERKKTRRRRLFVRERRITKEKKKVELHNFSNYTHK